MFEATLSLFKQQAKGLNYSFHRYTYGPFTIEAYEAWAELSWLGWLDVESGPSGSMAVTQPGRIVASTYERKLEKEWGGEFVLKVFKQVADTYCPLNTTELLRKVYTQEVEQVGLQRRLKIGDAQQGVYFTCIVDEENATNKLNIPKGACPMKLGREVSRHNELDNWRNTHRFESVMATKWLLLTISETEPGLWDRLKEELYDLFRSIQASKGEGILPSHWHQAYKDTFTSASASIESQKSGQSGTKVTVEDLKRRAKLG